jgi:hypothetical protein
MARTDSNLTSIPPLICLDGTFILSRYDIVEVSFFGLIFAQVFSFRPRNEVFVLVVCRSVCVCAYRNLPCSS